MKDSTYYLSSEAVDELRRLAALRKVDGYTGYLKYLAHIQPTLINCRPSVLADLDAERKSNNLNPLWEWEQGGKQPYHIRLPDNVLRYLEQVATQFNIKASYRRTNYSIHRAVIEAIGLGFIQEEQTK